MAENEVKLTKLAKCAGCGAKVGAGVLSQLLEGIRVHQDPNLLVGFDKSDDASVYRLTDELALVQTVDFFPPIADDPYTFGAIAAANALSDVYAMGGEPRLALNVRERLARMDRALHAFGIPEGLFQLDGVDMGLLVSEDQKAFGRLLGEFARKRSKPERARLARHLHGLRYVFDFRFHPSASAYSKTYAFGGDARDWAVIWVREREIVRKAL